MNEAADIRDRGNSDPTKVPEQPQHHEDGDERFEHRAIVRLRRLLSFDDPNRCYPRAVPPDPEDVARSYYDLFNQRRFDDAGELVDPQAVFHYLPTHQRLVGRAGYRALAAAWVIAFEDAQVDIQSVERLDEAHVRVTFIGRGTHTGMLELGEAVTIPPTGRRADLRFTDTLEVRDGRVVHVTFDFDVEELKRRLLPDRAGDVP